MERIVKFRPAFDKRHPDPHKDYGIHCVELVMILKGPQGCIQFVVFTNWMLAHVRKELDARNKDHLLCHPMAADIGYHSYIPRYDGQTPLTDSCSWLDGKPCYYDGSTLCADPILEKLISEGDEAVWQELERWYQEKLVATER